VANQDAGRGGGSRSANDATCGVADPLPIYPLRDRVAYWEYDRLPSRALVISDNP
jgi:hypothetical protein